MNAAFGRFVPQGHYLDLYGRAEVSVISTRSCSRLLADAKARQEELSAECGFAISALPDCDNSAQRVRPHAGLQIGSRQPRSRKKVIS